MKINLSNQSDSRKEDEFIHFHIEVNPEELKTKETPFGVKFSLGPDFKYLDEPGKPALPARIIQVALPVDATAIRIDAVSKKSRKLFKKPVFIMPVPELQVGTKGDGKGNGQVDRLDKDRVSRLKTVLQNQDNELRSIPSTVRSVIPDMEKYNHFLYNPPSVASIASTVVTGANKVLGIRINPITIDKDFIPELHESIEVNISFQRTASRENDKQSTVRSLTRNKAVQQSMIGNLKGKVINPNGVIDISDFPWYTFGSYDYLVITDNHRWDSELIEPKAEIGDMRAVFQKIVDWKRQKGLKARVVTITDIVNGNYGNFKAGAKDLQEVLRNFLKFAHSNWGVNWCLLGGDTEIVPVRQAAGEIRGDVSEQTVNNPPHDNEAFWTGTFMKIKPVSLGEWFSIYDDYLKLTNKNTGRLIPKKSPRNTLFPLEIRIEGPGIHLPAYPLFETLDQFRSRLGWYFCTDDTYATYSATPTHFVRVDGASSIIHAPLRFHYTWNTIPTDFYYASLFGPNYNLPGRHDWDYNNNGVYGQHEGTNQFDPINWNADIMIGRAPSSNTVEAETFVSKVIAYEKFRTADGSRLDRNYIDKMLLVSSNWGGRAGYSPTPSDPPEAGRFHTQPSQNRAILQTTDDTVLDFDWELISWVNDNDVWVIPYNRNAAPGIRGWYHAISPTDLRPAVFTFHLPWNTIEIPYITHTLVIYGNAADIAPNVFILDRTEADGSMMDQEALRQQVDSQLAFVQRFNRLYEDIDSLPLLNRLAAPVSRLTDGALTTALNEGHHFLSLSGHGSQWGCCALDTGKAAGLTNTNKLFIAFADSCLTNAFEYDDSMSEALLKNPNGGAVAYLGHTRFSWIGLGDDYEREFFHELVNTRHLGLMHNSRLNILQGNPNDHYHKWTVLALNLLGDPEMEVWKKKPLWLIPDLHYVKDRIYVRVYDPADLARKTIKKFNVTVYAGEQVFTTEPAEDGSIDFAKEWLEHENFRVVIKTADSLPHEINIEELKKLLATAKHEVPVTLMEEQEGEKTVDVISTQQPIPTSNTNVTVTERPAMAAQN